MLRLEPTIDLITGEPEPMLSENAVRVLEKRYLKKDETGKVTEPPRELFWRVSWTLAQAYRLYGATEEQVIERARPFYRMLAALEFLPNSPTLMNAGLDLQQLSACFVLPVEDSLSGIFQTLKESALIHQCLAGDTLIMTDRGLVEIRDAADAFRVDTEAGDLPMSHHWIKGRQSTYELRTGHGHTIQATPEHRLLAVTGSGEFQW